MGAPIGLRFTQPIYGATRSRIASDTERVLILSTRAHRSAYDTP